jgi:hypothetical protein
VLREEKGNWELKSNGAMESSRVVIFNSNQPLKPKRDERIALIILNAGSLGLPLQQKRKHERRKRERESNAAQRCTWEMPGLFLISHSEGSIYSLGAWLQLIKPNNIKAIHVTLICQRRQKRAPFFSLVSAAKYAEYLRMAGESFFYLLKYLLAKTGYRFLESS